MKQARLAAHLQDKVPPLEFREVPLGQFVAFLSELSTVPIAIDEESLVQAGKGPKLKVSVKLAGGTVEAALRAALAKPGLTFHVGPKQIVISAAAPANRRLRSRLLPTRSSLPSQCGRAPAAWAG